MHTTVNIRSMERSVCALFNVVKHNGYENRIYQLLSVYLGIINHKNNKDVTKS